MSVAGLVINNFIRRAKTKLEAKHSTYK